MAGIRARLQLNFYIIVNMSAVCRYIVFYHFVKCLLHARHKIGGAVLKSMKTYWEYHKPEF